MKPSLGLICIALLISPFVFGSVSSSSSPLKHPLLGIAPEDEKYYKTSSDWIKCKDGSKKFSKTQLNDDFCDCPDGTDEPGTSACPLGKFYCRNSGHAPLFLYSSRVNDGICDCCDGSDEYDGKVKCPNTCWEAGKVARDKLKKKIATYQEGVTLRKQDVEQAKLSLAKDEAELLKLKDEEKILKVLVEQLKERKDEIEKAEEKERLRKETEEKERKEAEEKANQEKSKTEQEANQGTSEAEEKTNNEEKPIESMHVDDIGTLEDSSADQDVATNNDESEAEVEYSDDSGNEGSHVDGVEQHAAEAKEESAVIPETVHDSESKGNDASENTEGLSKEELGRLVASRWTGENTEKQTEEVDAAKDKDHGGHEEIPEATHDEEDDGYASETDDDNQRYEDEDMEDEVDEDFREEDHYDSGSYKSESDTEPDLSDITTPSNPSWLEKIQKTVHNILRAVNLFQTSVNQTEAASVRKEYDDSSAKLSKLQSRISSLSQKLKHDFGPEKEFYSFYDRCFESKQNKYVYKVCPYKQASQEESHTTTRLGWLHLLEWSTNKWNHSNAYRPPYLVGLLSVESWPVVGATFGNIQGYGRWDKFEDSYRVMTFSNGDKCWNGPDRSLKVRLRCGLKNEVADVDEPSRCEYVALLSTPALCLEEKLKELQHKLELMNKEQPQSHDEL